MEALPIKTLKTSKISAVNVSEKRIQLQINKVRL